MQMYFICYNVKSEDALDPHLKHRQTHTDTDTDTHTHTAFPVPRPLWGGLRAQLDGSSGGSTGDYITPPGCGATHARPLSERWWKWQEDPCPRPPPVVATDDRQDVSRRGPELRLGEIMTNSSERTGHFSDYSRGEEQKRGLYFCLWKRKWQHTGQGSTTKRRFFLIWTWCEYTRGTYKEEALPQPKVVTHGLNYSNSSYDCGAGSSCFLPCRVVTVTEHKNNLVICCGDRLKNNCTGWEWGFYI